MSRKIIRKNENSLGGRLNLFRKSEGYNVSKFAHLIDISSGNMSDIENNNSKPSAKLLNNLILKTDINIHWLFTGEGEMTRATKNQAESGGGDAPVYKDGPEGATKPGEGLSSEIEMRLQGLEGSMREMRLAFERQHAISENSRTDKTLDIVRDAIKAETPPDGIGERRKCMHTLEVVLGPLHAAEAI